MEMLRSRSASSRCAGRIRATFHSNRVISEHGFTIPEILAFLFLFGLLLTAAIPVYREIDRHYDQLLHRKEARLFLQTQLEELLAAKPSEGEGNLPLSSSLFATKYHLYWSKRWIAPDLLQYEGTIVWNGQKLKLQVVRFVNRDLPWLKSASAYGSG